LSVYWIQLPAELVGRICMLRLPGSSLALQDKVSDISVDYFRHRQLTKKTDLSLSNCTADSLSYWEQLCWGFTQSASDPSPADHANTSSLSCSARHAWCL